MKRSSVWRVCSLFSLLVFTACAERDSTIDIRFSPCESVALRAYGASADELDSIEEASAIWNELGASLTVLLETERAEPPADGEIPVSFELAAPVFMGVYRDELGDIVINEAVDDPGQRTVVITHEIGHAFGLEHVTERESLMNEGNIDVLPNDADVASLDRLWPECGLSQR